MSRTASPLISVVTPVYGGAYLRELYHHLKTALSTITDEFEIIMVNDGSPDQAWEVITELAENDPKILGVDLSCNVGQHVAILAGLDRAAGEWVVVMDCDLQDRPEEIPRLYETAARDFDIVLARRLLRPSLRRLLPRAFYIVLRGLTGRSMDHLIANFGIYRRPAVEAILSMRERYFFPLIVRSVDLPLTSIDVQYGEGGLSSYGWAKLFKLAFVTIKANWSARLVKFPITHRNDPGYRVRAVCGGSEWRQGTAVSAIPLAVKAVI